MIVAPREPDGLEIRGALLLELRRSGVRDVNVLRAIETVQREIFTPHRLRDLAQRNCPLPIGCGQTMEAPEQLARMLEALAPEPSHRVLEIGAGSGYSAAVLSRLAREIVSLERYGSLATEAAARLDQLEIVNAAAHWGDGLGELGQWGSFDRIFAPALFEAPPATLLARLAPRGRLVCALKGENGDERLCILAEGVVQRLAPMRLPRLEHGLSRAL
ncbi:MAG: protein-L-isoaspartate(D-aspartate) O-methyltransferase [Hyphomicrobiales bacterium]|nr:protein-L-isoaspartate(D-aspartate) O-methyltransferase [Hyphomicrobiales bacterium]